MSGCTSYLDDGTASGRNFADAISSRQAWVKVLCISTCLCNLCFGLGKRLGYLFSYLHLLNQEGEEKEKVKIRTELSLFCYT